MALEARGHLEHFATVFEVSSGQSGFHIGQQVIDSPFAEAGWRALIDTESKIEGNRITVPASGFAVFGAKT